MMSRPLAHARANSSLELSHSCLCLVKGVVLIAGTKSQEEKDNLEYKGLSSVWYVGPGKKVCWYQSFKLLRTLVFIMMKNHNAWTYGK